MFRNALTELGLSNGCRAARPRPSSRPALEALEERVVLSDTHGKPSLTTVAESFLRQAQRLVRKFETSQIDTTAATIAMNNLDFQMSQLSRLAGATGGRFQSILEKFLALRNEVEPWRVPQTIPAGHDSSFFIDGSGGGQ